MEKITLLSSIVTLNLIIIFFFDKINFFKFVIDKPDKQRKFHKKPTALAGGIILIINILFYYLYLLSNENYLFNETFFKNFQELNLFVFSCLSIFFVGLLDDKFNFPPSLKFFLLFVIISILIFLDQSVKIEIVNFSFENKKFNLGNYSFIFTLFCFLVFINAFNMFDGINLQSSIYSIIIFLFLIFFNNSTILIIGLIFLLSFSYLNHNNKTFMGDNGSLLISFIIGYFFIKLYNENIILYSDQIFIFMMIPGIDMIRLFFERIYKKQNSFSYDRCHLHHLLLKKISYNKTILVINFLILIPIIFSYLNVNNFLIILFTIISYILILFKLRNEK
jgi:UDP-GlcNAc:undecaprenyl-phosphate GlcNAc-1-phosphate transferase